mgnify:CR=1 FL=1
MRVYYIKDGKKKTVIHALDDDSQPVETEKTIEDMDMLSVRETTAHALGIISVDDDKNCFYNEIMIPSNHPRPVRLAKRFRFYTQPKQANEMEIYVLQGESYCPADCTIAHKYVVSGIRHVRDGERIGTTIRVQYSYDANGIIRIQARQEDDKKDLPIRQERVTADYAMFRQPVKKQNMQGLAYGKSDESSLATSFSRIGNVAHKYRSITFSNVEWKPFDRIPSHPAASEFPEEKHHLIADHKKIRFIGYHVSQMHEGVTYTINPGSEFRIECDINTSTINAHPGGHLNIRLGLIKAELNEHGGQIFLDGKSVATVPNKFHLKMSLTGNGKYVVEVNKKQAGSAFMEMQQPAEIEFSFEHDSHYCSMRSDATISDINMTQMDNTEDEDMDVPTWAD